MARIGASRKRSLTFVGISIVSIALPSVDSSPLYQHRVPPTRRKVAYRRSHRKESFTPFWIPSDRAIKHARTESLEKHSRTRKLVTSHEPLEGDVFYHVIADAGRQNPDLVFSEIRQKVQKGDVRTTSEEKRPQQDSTTSELDSGVLNWLRRSLLEAAESVVGKLTDVQDRPPKLREGDDENSSAIEDLATGLVEADQSLIEDGHTTADGDFNVSAGFEYNVSAEVEQGAGNRTNDTSTAVFTESERTNSSATAKGDRFRPIRIRAILSEIEGGGQWITAEEHKILFEDILRPALLVWSAALRVDPVSGNLTVDVHQLVDNVTCGPGRDSGLPSVAVPISHLTQGVPNTDMILYLNLGFADSNRSLPIEGRTSNSAANTTNASSRAESDDSWDDRLDFSETPSLSGMPSEMPSDTSMPSQEPTHIPKHRSKTNDTSISGRWGENDTFSDLNATNSSGESHQPRPPTCSGDYLAASSFCSTDQYDRPTAAIMHICIDDSFFEGRSLRLNIMTVMHELGHALGFNSLSLAHFRRPNGKPRTRRENRTVPLTEVECTGPQSRRTFANVTLPSRDTLQFRTVRGGIRVAEVVTPSVVLAVRNHFDCQELHGAELESGEFLGFPSRRGLIGWEAGPPDATSFSCIGDHWERRLFKTDVMNPLVEGLEFNPRLSTVTLAYFADSGWYQVDLSRASSATSWGRGAGCSFTDKPCIIGGGRVPAGFESLFCNDIPALDQDGYATDINGCTADLTSKAACAIGRYNLTLPVEYQYFPDSTIGGSDAFMDYCPVYNGFTNGLCSDPENEALIRIDRRERIGERNSRCVAGLLSSARTALCLRIACVVEDRSFRVQVDGTWRKCSYKDQPLLSADGDLIICPDPIRICPTFYCQRDCLGTRQKCDYKSGNCVCRDAVCTNRTDRGKSFYKPHEENATSSLPEPDSPLSDYYVPTVRVLKDEGDNPLERWQMIVFGLGAFLVLAAAILLVALWRRKAVQAGDTDDGEDGTGGQATRNPNKDKMIASVVVDMRMNDPNLHDDAQDILRGDRSSETDLSMTDTDGADSRNSPSEISEEFSPQPEAVPEVPIDPLAPPTTVRRRNPQG